MSVKDMAAASKVSLRFQKDVLKLHGMGYQDTIAQGYTMKQCFAHAGVKRTRRAMGLSPRGRGNPFFANTNKVGISPKPIIGTSPSLLSDG